MKPAPSLQQRAAIEARGNVFVAAGAGTGKTAVLVERFVASVVDEGVDIDSLLVITYTERAAGELRARIRSRLIERGRPDLALELDGAWVSTIHGFCRRLLGAYPFAARIDPRLLNKRQIESLVGAGAFDSIVADRPALYAAAETILAHATSAADERPPSLGMGMEASSAKVRTLWAASKCFWASTGWAEK